MRKEYSLIFFCCFPILVMTIFNCCTQEVVYSKASIETAQVTFITEATATCGGIITADGGSNVTLRGVCWNTSPYPTIENDTTIDAAGTGPFSSLIEGLFPGTTYYVRAYAINEAGINYGLQMTFTTKTFSIITTPISVSLLTATSAIGGGNIISDGDSSSLTVIARGICWNSFPSPTIENYKTFDGVGGGKFTSKMDSLTAFTTYYARAYVTNGNGTIYGNEVSFTTLSGVILLTTTTTSFITAFTATSGGAITSDGGAPVTSRGVCWNTSPSPTTANNKTATGSGVGTFTSNITGLTSSTTYFVRAYATNSVGTSYGNEMSFTSSETVTDMDGNIYKTVKIGTQVWMAENLKTTKYRNGESIGTTTPANKDISSESTPKYQWTYNGDEGNASKYGRLYTWYTLSDSRNIAPTGWHVATDAEWTTLENYLIVNGYNYDGTTTGNKIAKSLAATAGWSTSTTTGAIGHDLTKNNSSGFTGLPGGKQIGAFYGVGSDGYWWSSTEYSADYAWCRSLEYGSSMNYGSSNSYSYYDGKQYGFSVRCVKDN